MHVGTVLIEPNYIYLSSASKQILGTNNLDTKIESFGMISCAKHV